MILAAVDWGKLVELVWAAVRAGLTTSTLFATFIVGATRATDLRRAGRPAAATALYAMSVVSALACVAGIAFGLTIILSK